ncbi:hypothetical protein ACFULT_26450 [Rhodococcus sp. NPDC057297]|uniref:hypothetical protein n=1 Tax=Rhodococcus sp. NPDC057297 TaxID=3346090 RepID=UPI003633E25C
MRIRSIKPEFWRSDDITDLDIEDRLLFIGLWSYVDDNGVGKDKLADICADLFAADLERDPRETFARVSRGILNLTERGLLHRYSVDSRPFLEIVSWKNHQRIDKPGKARYPDSTSENAEFARPSRDPRETLAPGAVEQRNRGAEEKESSSAKPPRKDVDELCFHLHARIIANGGKATIGEKWRTEARLLIDNDGVDPQQAHRLIDWCQNDTFWHSNILSMPKFRQQYGQLLMKARAAERPPGRGPAGLTPREMELAQAELHKEHPDQELLRRAGLTPPNHLRAIEGGY